MGKRIEEFLMGLIGSIFGFIGSFLLLAIGFFASKIPYLMYIAPDFSDLIILGWLGLLFSILGFVGCAIVNDKPKVAGGLMVISACGGVFVIGFPYALAFVMLLIAGGMAFLREVKE